MFAMPEGVAENELHTRQFQRQFSVRTGVLDRLGTIAGIREQTTHFLLEERPGTREAILPSLVIVVTHLVVHERHRKTDAMQRHRIRLQREIDRSHARGARPWQEAYGPWAPTRTARSGSVIRSGSIEHAASSPTAAL